LPIKLTVANTILLTVARHTRRLPRLSSVLGRRSDLRQEHARRFGVISVYDIQQGSRWATVPIYYESRMAKLELDAREKPNDEDFEKQQKGGIDRKEKLKTKWPRKAVSAEKRVALIAKD
jgi:type I restriction enzyme R subunit